VRDNDGAYGQTFKDQGRAMGIRDRPISPRSPWQNPYVERLIGTGRFEIELPIVKQGEFELAADLVWVRHIQEELSEILLTFARLKFFARRGPIIIAITRVHEGAMPSKAG
jgi:hypothetical protein